MSLYLYQRRDPIVSYTHTVLYSFTHDVYQYVFLNCMLWGVIDSPLVQHLLLYLLHTEDSNTSETSSNNGGMIAGIVIAVFLAIILAVAVTILIYRQHQRKSSSLQLQYSKSGVLITCYCTHSFSTK